MPEVRLDSVSKCFQVEKRSFAAVEDVSLSIQQGEFVFVTGSSGAGKTTLLQLICGDIRPTTGAVYLDQTNINQPGLWSRDRIRTAYGQVSQIPQLMRKRTVAENLKMAAMVKRGRKVAPVQVRMEKVLRMVGVPNVQDKYPVELSGGECRRVELARAIINSPPILMLDELTSNLDEDTIWDIFHLLSELNRRGTTIIMATHAKKFVNLMRKRVITLVDGRIFGDVQKGRYGDVVSG